MLGHRTIRALPLTSDEREAGKRLTVLPGPPRPVTRGDCAGGPRPCPWVSCRFHLYLEVHPTSGAIWLNFPGRDVHELQESCALDVADRGPSSLLHIGTLLNVTLERVRQIQVLALETIRRDEPPELKTAP